MRSWIGYRMRYYFNLVNALERIPDSEGVEAASLFQAEEQALTAIEELRYEDGDTSLSWAGWRLEVTDASGALMLCLDLGEMMQKRHQS